MLWEPSTNQKGCSEVLNVAKELIRFYQLVVLSMHAAHGLVTLLHRLETGCYGCHLLSCLHLKVLLSVKDTYITYFH